MTANTSAPSTASTNVVRRKPMERTVLLLQPLRTGLAAQLRLDPRNGVATVLSAHLSALLVERLNLGHQTP